MEIFDRKAPWPNKVNFVDENNVVVGYDMNMVCCEEAGWFIADDPTTEVAYSPISKDIDSYVFDPEYFEEAWGVNIGPMTSIVIFRLINGEEEKFLHLYNCHEGYYHHGFEMTVNGTKKVGGSI